MLLPPINKQLMAQRSNNNPSDWLGRLYSSVPAKQHLSHPPVTGRAVRGMRGLLLGELDKFRRLSSLLCPHKVSVTTTDTDVAAGVPLIASEHRSQNH